jgi:hypothetical protein
MAMTAWAVKRVVARAVREGRAGSKVVDGQVVVATVDRNGGVTLLGVVDEQAFDRLAWAVDVAYRVTPARWERTRLAGLRLVVQGLARQARVARAKGGGQGSRSRARASAK